MQNIKVYDNGGSTVDRYTIVFMNDPIGDNYGCLGVDAFGGRYFSNYSECKDGAHLGKLIHFNDLPNKTKLHVLSRIEEYLQIHF